MEARWGSDVSTEMRCRFELALGRALSLTGREDSAFEALERAFQMESDGAFAAALAIELSEGSHETARKRAFLNWGVARAPFHQGIRLARFQEALSQGEMDVALADADRLEAMASTDEERARRCVQIGEAFTEQGHPEWGRKWLTRALRLSPDDQATLLALADALRNVGELLRAAVLLQVALRHLDEILRAESSEADPLPIQNFRVELALTQRARARYALASLFVELDAEPSQALGLLSGVDTRSDQGVLARILEAELHNRAGRKLSRDRVLSRLLEGLELGWADLETFRKSSDRFFELIQATQDESLLRFAERVTKWKAKK
jgi:tetratricopeptide (TPR) repeat protein